MTRIKVAPETSPGLNDEEDVFVFSNSDTTINLENEKKNDQHQDQVSVYELNVTSSSSGSDASSGALSFYQSTTSKSSKKRRKRVALCSCSGLYIRFSCLFMSPLFLKHRNVFFLIGEALFPALIIFGVVAAFTGGISWKHAYYEKEDSDKAPQPKFYPLEMEDAMELFTERYTNARQVLIVFTPVTNLTKHIMNEALAILHLETDNKVNREKANTGAVGVANVSKMIEKIKEARKPQAQSRNPIGVVFQYDHKHLDPVTNFPQTLSYSIRHSEDSISNTHSDVPYVKPIRFPDTQPDYADSGFIGLQYAIGYAYFTNLIRTVHPNAPGNGVLRPIDDSDNEEDLFARDSDLSEQLQSLKEAPIVKLQMFYHPNFYNTHIRWMVIFSVCCCMVVAYVFTNCFLVRQIILDRQSGVKELLGMHGSSPVMHWIILLFHALVFRALLALLVTIILCAEYGHGRIVSLSNVFLVFLLLWEHLLALTFFNYLLATLVESAMCVGIYTILIDLFSFFIPITLKYYKVLSSFGNIAFAGVFPNWALYNVMHNIINFELDDKGASWGNFRRSVFVGDTNLTIFGTMWFMGIHGSAYFLLALYRDLICCCCCNVCARCVQKQCYKLRQRQNQNSANDDKDFEKPTFYEDPSEDEKCCIRIRNLCKKQGKQVILDSINLDIMRNEITVILGNANSGKSTLMAILAGKVTPTSGYATINNVDVTDTEAQSLTGFTAHDMIFFGVLTVQQNIYKCFRLRGYFARECKNKTKVLLGKLKLWNMRDKYPDYLTKNELRRLNIAMTMASSPRALLLDEPNDGTDAFERGDMYGSLHAVKDHNTVVLSGNNMEDAGYIADKIVLLDKGRVMFSGSVDFLHKQFETGFFLQCEPYHKKKIDADAVLELVKLHFENNSGEVQKEETSGVKREKTSAIKKEDVEDILVIKMPIIDAVKYSELSRDLDGNLKRLGIRKYTFRKFDLTDVILKMSEPPEEETAPQKKSKKRQKGCCRTTNPCLMCILFTIFIACMIFGITWDGRRISGQSNPPFARNLTFEPYHNFLKPEGGVEILYQVSHFYSPIQYEFHIKKILGNLGKVLPNSQVLLSTLTDMLKDKTSADQTDGYIKERHLAALRLRFVKDAPLELIGYFANGVLHSPPIILNTILNILLSALTGHNETSYRIYCINHPLP